MDEESILYFDAQTCDTVDFHFTFWIFPNLLTSVEWHTRGGYIVTVIFEILINCSNRCLLSQVEAIGSLLLATTCGSKRRNFKISQIFCLKCHLLPSSLCFCEMYSPSDGKLEWSSSRWSNIIATDPGSTKSGSFDLWVISFIYWCWILTTVNLGFPGTIVGILSQAICIQIAT